MALPPSAEFNHRNPNIVMLDPPVLRKWPSKMLSFIHLSQRMIIIKLNDLLKTMRFHWLPVIIYFVSLNFGWIKWRVNSS